MTIESCGSQMSHLPIRHITASLFLQPPWVNKCGIEVLQKKKAKSKCLRPGLNVEMFILMAELLNFNYTIKVGEGMGAPDDSGDYGNTMLGILQHKKADMSVNTAYQTFARNQIVNYMTPNGNSKLAVLLAKDTGTLRGDTLFLPFQRLSWTLIFGSMFAVWVIGILFLLADDYMVSKYRDGNSTEKLSKRKVFEKPNNLYIIQHRLLTISGQSFLALIHHGKRASGMVESSRFLIFTFQLVMSVIAILYGSVLFNYFSKTHTFKVPFSTVEEFANAIINQQYTVMIPEGINQFLKSYLTISKTTGMIQLKEALELYPPKEIPNSDRFNAPLMLSMTTAYIDIDFTLNIMLAQNCSLVLQPLNGIEGNFYAPVFSKDFPYVECFNQWAHIITAYYTKLETMYAYSPNPADCEVPWASETTAKPLTMSHFWNLFVVWGSLNLVAFFIFILGLVKHRHRINKEQKSNNNLNAIKHITVKSSNDTKKCGNRGDSISSSSGSLQSQWTEDFSIHTNSTKSDDKQLTMYWN